MKQNQTMEETVLTASVGCQAPEVQWRHSAWCWLHFCARKPALQMTGNLMLSLLPPPAFSCSWPSRLEMQGPAGVSACRARSRAFGPMCNVGWEFTSDFHTREVIIILWTFPQKEGHAKGILWDVDVHYKEGWPLAPALFLPTPWKRQGFTSPECCAY